MPRGKKFATGKLDETLEALNKVAPKPKTSINLRELIRGLKPKIKRLRSQGYEWHEIVQLLKEQGIEIASDTLKEYLKTPRRRKVKPATEEPLSEGLEDSKKGKQGRDNKPSSDSKPLLESEAEVIEDQEPPPVELDSDKPRRKLKSSKKDETAHFNL